tara:strand:- start:208 stop:330 length:123 start_codon:yes stop_codon:yes gene_type:complete
LQVTENQKVLIANKPSRNQRRDTGKNDTLIKKGYYEKNKK